MEVEVGRASWDNYFVQIAVTVSTRATCDRKHVGCVLVKDRVIVATGYNGSVRGLPHCDDEGHDLVNDHCVRTVHADANAVAAAARQGSATAGATAYVTAFPCWGCFRLLVNAGIERIVYADAYRMDPRVVAAAPLCGVVLDPLNGSP